MLKTNNLSKISFKDLYIEQKLVSDFKSKTPSEWDKKANSFNDFKKHEEYVKQFLNFVDFSECDSLLDFACGTGFLSMNVPIKNLILCDFSHAMLEIAKKNCPNAKILQGSFDDIKNIKTDLVFASRCLDVSDLSNALQILLNSTKRRLYFSYKIDNSYIDERIIQELDLDIHPTPNFIYAANILYELGYFFTINKISIENKSYFKDYESFKNSVEFSYKTLSEEQNLKLKKLYNENKNLNKNKLEWAIFCVEK
ncbi:class I SAM-dependent methyltransferase [Campylobacter sp. MG1]|uniref:class I SAM-dependent methyltransferase n=1 Tax=Campylobacter sp. MG1 TaxID=2976332 RepID=UPI00226CA927|nr:class I SAM-dependent methyltransferase [Campylobacter sp. MG1]